MFIPWPVRLFGKKSAVASPPVVSFETNLWPKMLAKCINMTGCFDEFSVLKWLPQLSVSLCTWSWTWQLKLDSWGLKRIAGEHFGNTSGYSPMVFEHHDFEALQCWNGSHSNWSMNISDGGRERESGLQLFVDGLSFQLYFFPFMFLFFPLWRLFRPKMVTDTRIIERCNKKREPASSLTQLFFFPHPAYGIGDFGNVAVSQN